MERFESSTMAFLWFHGARDKRHFDVSSTVNQGNKAKLWKTEMLLDAPSLNDWSGGFIDASHYYTCGTELAGDGNHWLSPLLYSDIRTNLPASVPAKESSSVSAPFRRTHHDSQAGGRNALHTAEAMQPPIFGTKS